MRSRKTNDDDFLSHLLLLYRDLLGEYEPSPSFVAKVWLAIDARKAASVSWSSYLVAWSPRLAAASMVLAALLALSQLVTSGSDSRTVVLESSYEDVLILNAMDQNDGAIWVVAENGQ